MDITKTSVLENLSYVWVSESLHTGHNTSLKYKKHKQGEKRNYMPITYFSKYMPISQQTLQQCKAGKNTGRRATHKHYTQIKHKQTFYKQFLILMI
jgi:hypothetical protein